MAFLFRTWAPDRALRPGRFPAGPPWKESAPLLRRPHPGSATLLTGWRRRGAGGSTAPSSSAPAVSCDCSPAEGGGRSRARGRGPPGRPAAGGRPGRGEGAGKGVRTDTAAAAPPGRLGAPAPFSSPTWTRPRRAASWKGRLRGDACQLRDHPEPCGRPDPLDRRGADTARQRGRRPRTHG